MNFSEEELKLIEQYKKMPVGFKNRINIWAVEILPPILFVDVFIYTGKELYLLATILALVLFNVTRLARQNNTVKTLKSICQKLSEIKLSNNIEIIVTSE